MGVFDFLRSNHITLNEAEAEWLQHPSKPWYSVEVLPPRNQDTPSTLPYFVSGILEIQNKWLGLKNTSPTVSYEIRRAQNDKLRFQYSVPTKRLERKVRTQLADEIPGVKFRDGVNGLPVYQDETLGGGLLHLGDDDWYTLNTEHDSPPINAVTALLHRHSMQNTKFVIQVLFQPIAAKNLRNWWWRKKAVQQRNYLKKEKQGIWGSTQPTRREKQQAHSINQKIGNARYWTSIRFLIINADEYTPSRIKELAGGFNRFENPETNQYFNTVTFQPFIENRLRSYAETVRDRRFGGWSRKFRTTQKELSSLVSLPDRNQSNISYSTP